MEQQNAPPFLPPSIIFFPRWTKKSMGFDKTLPDTAGNICQNETNLKYLHFTILFSINFSSNVHTFGLLKVQDEKGSVHLAPLARPVGGTEGPGPVGLLQLTAAVGQGRRAGHFHTKSFFKKSKNRVLFQFVSKKINLCIVHDFFSRKLMKLSSHCALPLVRLVVTEKERRRGERSQQR